jgi:hypothetical protein
MSSLGRGVLLRRALRGLAIASAIAGAAACADPDPVVKAASGTVGWDAIAWAHKVPTGVEVHFTHSDGEVRCSEVRGRDGSPVIRINRAGLVVGEIPVIGDALNYASATAVILDTFGPTYDHGKLTLSAVGPEIDGALSATGTDSAGGPISMTATFSAIDCD